MSIRNCKKCKKEFLYNQSKSKVHCIDCKEKHWSKLNWDDLKKDLTRKVWLIKEKGNRCELCGLTEWYGNPAPIEIDHIDGNSDNNCKENLRLLCANCHYLTPTHAGKNAKRFKTNRAHIMLKYRGKYR